MNSLLIAALVTVFAGAQVHAQSTTTPKEKASGETSLKIEDVKEKNKVEGNIDEEITNAKLRAESGSKSKWSGSIAASYAGGSLEKPFSKDRPNPTRARIAPRVTMGGDMNVRYRVNKNQSFSAGVGYSLERPLHEAKKGDITNPRVGTNYVGKIGAVQSVSELQLIVTTDSDELEAGSVATIVPQQVFMYDVGTSKLSIGLALDGYYTQYNKDENKLVRIPPRGFRPAGDYQEDYGVGIYPLAEYAVTDKLQLRTVFRPWNFDHSPYDDGFKFSKKPWTQSFGVGYAVTRDVYLYPNFQWDWEAWRSNNYDFTDKDVRSASMVGLNATINVF